MKIRAAVLMLVAVAGCSQPSTDAAEWADEALAEAQRANDRADELEMRLDEIEEAVANNASSLSNEVSEREIADEHLRSEMQTHTHY